MKIDVSMFGDMAIKDLTPKDANSSGRIIKNLRICGSGLYEYHVSEAPLMGLSIPGDYAGETFKIYRPAEVLEANKELYARVPIITGHHVRVNTSNAKQLAVGMIGDTVQTEVGDDGELYLYTTGTIITGDGIAAYEQFGELSVGYDPIVEWAPGTHKGQSYQAVLKGFNEINHVLICKTARGGHQCMIMDSLDVFEKAQSTPQNKVCGNILNGGKAMGLFTKIFAKPAEQKIAGDARVVSAMLQSVKAGADAKTQVAAVKAMLGDKVDDKLKEYFEELSGDEVAKADKEIVGKAIDVVDAYCQKLLGDEHPANCACDECKSKKAEPGDKEPEKKEEPTDKKPEEKKPEAGDKEPEKKEEPKPANGDAIDYEKLATMVAAKLQPQKEEPKVNGDALAALAPVISGDAVKDGITSDALMAAIF